MDSSNNIIKHFTVSGFVFDKGRVLLIRHPKLHKWIYPGGHIEKNETPEEALIREIKEETNYDALIIDTKSVICEDEKVKTLNTPFCILYEYIPKYRDEEEHYHIDLVYLCTLQCSSVYNMQIDSAHCIKWFTYEETLELDLFTNFKDVLKQAFFVMNKVKGGNLNA